MKTLLTSLLVLLNVADGGLTLYGISIGAVVEANPIQGWWMEVLGSFWLPAKITFVALLAVLLWHRYDKNWKARWGLWLTTLIYAGIILYHITGLWGVCLTPGGEECFAKNAVEVETQGTSEQLDTPSSRDVTVATREKSANKQPTLRPKRMNAHTPVNASSRTTVGSRHVSFEPTQPTKPAKGPTPRSVAALNDDRFWHSLCSKQSSPKRRVPRSNSTTEPPYQYAGGSKMTYAASKRKTTCSWNRIHG